MFRPARSASILLAFLLAAVILPSPSGNQSGCASPAAEPTGGCPFMPLNAGVVDVGAWDARTPCDPATGIGCGPSAGFAPCISADCRSAGPWQAFSPCDPATGHGCSPWETFPAAPPTGGSPRQA